MSLSPACREDAPGARPLLVAAAADLQHALGDIAPAFARAEGRGHRASLGSTGLLAHQIRAGAPFDLFLSASAEHVDRLAAEGRIVPGSRARYARGRLCLYVRQGGPPVRALPDLAGPGVRRIALANPEHAPYGRAAHEALRRAGLSPGIAAKLVMSENVRQALQFAQTGNADAALVACSLLRDAPGDQVAGVPAEAHPPIEQVLGIVRGGDEAGAGRLARFLLSPAGQEILGRHGFLPP